MRIYCILKKLRVSVFDLQLQVSAISFVLYVDGKETETPEWVGKWQTISGLSVWTETLAIKADSCCEHTSGFAIISDFVFTTAEYGWKCSYLHSSSPEWAKPGYNTVNFTQPQDTTDGIVNGP